MSYARNLARIARAGAPTVDTAQDLRDMPIYSGLYPERVETLGALVAGDGGGGAWRWDASSQDDDNLGTVLLSTGHVGAGRWARVIESTLIDVRWFGADPLGVNHSSSAIQAACDFVRSIGGGEISLPAGTFLMNDAIYPHSHTTIRGAGKDATVLLTDINASLGTRQTTISCIIGYNNPQWPDYVYYDIDDISVGDKTVTVTSGTPNFEVGEIAVIRAGTVVVDTDAEPLYRFVETVKIIGINGAVLELEYPLTESIGSAFITRADAGVDPRPGVPDGVDFVEDLHVTDLAMIHPDDPAADNTAAFRCRSLYNSSLERIKIHAHGGILLNGACHCTLRDIDIEAYFHFIEVKVGCYDVEMYNIRITHNPDIPGYGTYTGPAYEVGEFARNIHADGIDYDASRATEPGEGAVFFPQRYLGGDNTLRNVRVVASDIRTIVRVPNFVNPGPRSILVENIEARANTLANNIEFLDIEVTSGTPSDTLPNNIVIQNVNVKDATYTSSYGVFFQVSTKNVSIIDCELPGTIHSNLGDVTLDNSTRFISTIYDGFSGESVGVAIGNEAKFIGCTRSKDRELTNQNSAGTTTIVTSGTTAVTLLTVTFPTGYPAIPGDYVELISPCELQGYAGAKTLTLSDGTDTIWSFSSTTAISTNVRIRIFPRGAAGYDAFIHENRSDGTSNYSYYPQRNVNLTAGATLVLSGQCADAGEEIRQNMGSVDIKLLGEN